MIRLALLSVLLIGGCHTVHPPVPIAGDADALAGVWEGTYESEDTGRVGDITFALDAEAGAAVGEVVMVPRGSAVTVRRRDDGTWRWDGVARPQILAIEFVRLEGDRISGRLAPYGDPDCGCTLRTTFEGTIEGDRAVGTFASEAESPFHNAEGTWTVVRRVER